MSNNQKVEEFTKRLNRWYQKNEREFPWRDNQDIYPLLIAEILLQQTKAEQVIPVFKKIIKQYPDPKSLSNADSKALLNIIKPLGIFRRVKILKDAGRQLLKIDDHNVSLDDLLQIKGVGDYTARAVLTQLYNNSFSLLDPNFIRIFYRVFGARSNNVRPRADKKFREDCKKYFDSENPRKYLFAMLDFGAIQCKANSPECTKCIMYNDVCQGIEK